MSRLNLFRGLEFKNSKLVKDRVRKSDFTTHLSAKKYRSFNLGKFENTEVSIFLEISSDQISDYLNLIIKNEGPNNVSDIQLIVKVSSQIVIENRGEVFGTSKQREVIGLLPKNRSLIYSTRIRIYEDLKPAFIFVELVKKSKTPENSNLSVHLTIPPKISRLGA